MDWINEFILYRKDIFGFLWPEFALYFAIAILALSITFTLLKAFFVANEPKKKRKSADELIETIHRECAGCRWEGNLARHNKVCPRCGQSNFVE